MLIIELLMRLFFFLLPFLFTLNNYIKICCVYLWIHCRCFSDRNRIRFRIFIKLWDFTKWNHIILFGFIRYHICSESWNDTWWTFDFRTRRNIATSHEVHSLLSRRMAWQVTHGWGINSNKIRNFGFPFFFAFRECFWICGTKCVQQGKKT